MQKILNYLLNYISKVLILVGYPYLQDDSSTSSTMVTNSSHTSQVCFDHDRRSHCSFTVHGVHTVDHVGAYATQYRHVRTLRTRERELPRVAIASRSHAFSIRAREKAW